MIIPVLVCLVVLVGCGDGGREDQSAPTRTSVVTPNVTATPTPTVVPTATPTGAGLRGFAVGPLRSTSSGGGAVLRAEDSEIRWHRVFAGDAFGPLGLRVAFADPRNGWLVDRVSGSSSRIFHTDDAGASWSSQSENVVPIKGFIELHDIAFQSANRGVAVGAVIPESHVAFDARPLVLVTDDGGLDWRRATLTQLPGRDRPGALSSVCFASPDVGIAAGSSAFSGPVVLRTGDGGATWRDITSSLSFGGGELAAASSVGCAAPGSFWVGGNGFGGFERPAVLHSTDSGVTWIDRSPTVARELRDRLPTLDFVDATRGWALLERSLVVLRTADGGASWIEEAPAADLDGVLTAIDFLDAEHGVGVGADAGSSPPSALVVTTSDGGTSWQRVPVEPGDALGLDDVTLVR